MAKRGRPKKNPLPVPEEEAMPMEVPESSEAVEASGGVALAPVAETGMSEVGEVAPASAPKPNPVIPSRFSKMDPKIPEGREVYVAVYSCTQGHKTKATNLQAEEGVQCYECSMSGKKEIAKIMPQFITNGKVRR